MCVRDFVLGLWSLIRFEGIKAVRDASLVSYEWFFGNSNWVAGASTNREALVIEPNAGSLFFQTPSVASLPTAAPRAAHLVQTTFAYEFI